MVSFFKESSFPLVRLLEFLSNFKAPNLHSYNSETDCQVT